jgi:hypothetical protein
MTIQQPPISVEQVSCEVCLKEVPKSEASVAEASDYFLYFCGLECFEKWKEQDEMSKSSGNAPS